MKTIEQWLNELESPYREQALSQIDKNVLNNKVKSIHDALLELDWTNSKQGHRYWYDVWRFV